ncbi:MAG: hypothetical protein WDN09_01565 [bacterium]
MRAGIIIRSSTRKAKKFLYEFGKIRRDSGACVKKLNRMELLGFIAGAVAGFLVALIIMVIFGRRADRDMVVWIAVTVLVWKIVEARLRRKLMEKRDFLESDRQLQCVF